MKFVYQVASCILALYLPEAISDQDAKLVSEENEVLTSSAILCLLDP